MNRKYSKELVAEISAMVGKKTLDEIAEQTALTKTQIRGLLSRNGVEVKKSLDNARQARQNLSRPCSVCPVENKDGCKCPVWEAWLRHEWNDVVAMFRGKR